MTTDETRRSRTTDDWAAIGADLGVVVAFAIIGRLSHGESLAPREILDTGIPFGTALLICHLILRRFPDRARQILPGAGIWLVTWGLGIGLRLLMGDTAAPAFVGVSAAFLAAGLIGWRAVLAGINRVREQRRSRR